MGIFSALFGGKSRNLLLETIRQNAAIIERNEKRTRTDAEYSAICLVLDDLASRPDGQSGQRLVMDILLNDYPQHYVTVMTYLAINSCQVKLRPEIEHQITKRHRKRG
jgi:hypothetical protein